MLASYVQCSYPNQLTVRVRFIIVELYPHGSTKMCMLQNYILRVPVILVFHVYCYAIECIWFIGFSQLRVHSVQLCALSNVICKLVASYQCLLLVHWCFRNFWMGEREVWWLHI